MRLPVNKIALRVLYAAHSKCFRDSLYYFHMGLLLSECRFSDSLR